MPPPRLLPATPPETGHPPPTSPQAGHAAAGGRALLLAALGVVFGDLVTSPLYALQEAFHPGSGVLASPDNVLGIVSLFLWSLILMVSVKYVAVLMSADNRGEGGLLALLALLLGQRASNESAGGVRSAWSRRWVYLALIGTAMLYGDGVITPAISVLSAVEGLQIATPAFDPYIVPLTVAILAGLFAVQSLGSGRVGLAFGPILLAWLLAILLLGLNSIWQTPQILAALNPLHGLRFFAHNGLHGFLALGAVVLCLTGGEALYADMGHFGARPIRQAWYRLAMPALVCSYLGQGALLLRDPAASGRPFYSTVPDWALYPMVLLATLATVVAAQALITAVFSLTRQAAQLGLFPRVGTRHTSDSTEGQVYLPLLNWVLMGATVAVVLGFRSSSALAAAFGLAVSTTMAITTVLFAALARSRWHWSRRRIAAVAGVFLIVDLAFVAANAVKFADGGWLPFLIGTLMFTLSAAWFSGSTVLRRARADTGLPLELFVESLAHSPPHRVCGTAVFLQTPSDTVPNVLLHHLKHNQVLHEHVVLLSLCTDEAPRVPDAERLQVQCLGQGFVRMQARYGYMESPDVPALLQQAGEAAGLPAYDPMRCSFYLGSESLVAPPRGPLLQRALMHLFIWLHHNAPDASTHFRIPPNRVVELGARLELLAGT